MDLILDDCFRNVNPIDYRDYHRDMADVYKHFMNALKYNIIKSRFFGRLPYNRQAEIQDAYYIACKRFAYHNSALEHFLSH